MKGRLFAAPAAVAGAVLLGVGAQSAAAAPPETCTAGLTIFTTSVGG